MTALRTLALAASLALAATGSNVQEAAATTSYPSLGFEEDVDVVVSPTGRFLLMPEESPDGTQGRITVVRLNPADGTPLGLGMTWAVPGFEQGADPMILPQFADGSLTAIVPVESADGSQSGIFLLRLNADGALLDSRAIALGDLGFREDVDPLWTKYQNPGIGFAALESEDGAVRGILAIDVDPNDEPPAGNAWGSCTLLSTDGRAGCSGGFVADWLLELAEGVDPIAYEVDDAARLAIPGIADTGNDLLLVDFDPHFEPPSFLGWSSVAETNEGGAHPIAFPGWEMDVDLLYQRGECGAGPIRIVVPVEGGGESDLYALDADGQALWVLSDAADAAGETILGFEAGIDVIPMCGLGGGHPNRLVVPLENEGETDADLWIVDLDTGGIIARAEDPAVNPGLVLPGYEIGVGPVRWDADHLLVPYESDDEAGLFAFDNDATLVDELAGAPVTGFLRSVDPTVAPLADASRKLYVPVQGSEEGDADILIFPTVGNLGVWNSVEALNPAVELGRFEIDVDMGLVDHWLPGQAWVYLPEEPDAGASRLRCELITAGARLLLVAMTAEGATPSRLFTVHGTTGTIIQRWDDVRGLEAGLDMTNGTGHVERGNPPGGVVAAGSDPDADPTNGEPAVPAVVLDGLPRSIEPWIVEHANPYRPDSPIRIDLQRAGSVRVEILDASGRRLRLLHEGPLDAGAHVLDWDGRDDRGGAVANGVYFVRMAGAGSGSGASKLVLVRG